MRWSWSWPRALGALVSLCLLGACAGGGPLASRGGAGADAPAALLPDGTTAVFHGEITFESAGRLLDLLRANPQVGGVLLSSDGGYLLPALRLASALQLRGLRTSVEGDCLSACTLLFLAGRERLLAAGGRLGFHRAWQEGEVAEGETTLEANRQMRRRLAQRGVTADFIERVLATPGSRLWYPRPDELLAAGVVTGLLPR